MQFFRNVICLITLLQQFFKTRVYFPATEVRLREAACVGGPSRHSRRQREDAARRYSQERKPATEVTPPRGRAPGRRVASPGRFTRERKTTTLPGLRHLSTREARLHPGPARSRLTKIVPRMARYGTPDCQRTRD